MSPTRTAIALSIVWSAALGSLVVLVDTFRAPAVPTPAPGPPSVRVSAEAPALAVGPVIELERTWIFAARPRPPAARPHATRDPRCAVWRDLVQGDVSLRVRACD